METTFEPAVIKTDAQYREYLQQVEALISRNPDPESSEGRRLDLLGLLIETYEKEIYSIPSPDPIDAILFRLEQKGLQQKDLVPLIGTKGRVSEVLSGKRRLTVPMVRSLSAHLDIPAEVLIREPQTESTSLADFAPISTIREIVKRGWVEGSSARVNAKSAEEFVRKLLDKVGTHALGPAYLRSSIHAGISGHVNLHAIQLWIARILIKSRDSSLNRGAFSRDRFNENVLREIGKLSWLDDGPKLALEYLSKLGVAVVIEDHLPGTRLDGAAAMDIDGTPVIGLTLRHDRLDNFWFTLIHECAHVAKHLKDPGEAFVDETEKPFDDEVKEIEANRMARDALIPPEVWRRSDANRLKNAESILKLASELRIHPAIVAGRIRRESGNYKVFSNLIGHRKIKAALLPDK